MYIDCTYEKYQRAQKKRTRFMSYILFFHNFLLFRLVKYGNVCGSVKRKKRKASAKWMGIV